MQIVEKIFPLKKPGATQNTHQLDHLVLKTESREFDAAPMNLHVQLLYDG